MTEGKFEIYKDIAEKYRFRLKVSNYKIVAVGEAYETKDGCLNGVKAVKDYCDAETVDLTIGELAGTNEEFEVFQDKAKKYRFRLRTDSKIISIGEGCNSKESCIEGINEVQETHPEYRNAIVKDYTSGQTTIILNKINYDIKENSRITFTGKLIGNESGDGIVQANISIFESDGSILKETPLASGNTNVLGNFNIDWVAKKMDWWDSSVEVYAKFNGATTLEPACSEKLVLCISK